MVIWVAGLQPGWPSKNEIELAIARMALVNFATLSPSCADIVNVMLPLSRAMPLIKLPKMMLLQHTAFAGSANL